MDRFVITPLLISSLSFVLAGPIGCARSEEGQATKTTPQVSPAVKDVCDLLTLKELETILGERPDHTEKSSITSGGFLISQCFFHMPTYSNSVSVQVTRRAPGPKGVDPRAFLEKKMEEREGGEEGEKEERPLDMVPGLGDKAIWMGTAVGGTLYLLKDDLYVRISVGSLKEPGKRREKAIALAKVVGARL